MLHQWGRQWIFGPHERVSRVWWRDGYLLDMMRTEDGLGPLYVKISGSVSDMEFHIRLRVTKRQQEAFFKYVDQLDGIERIYEYK